MSSNFDDILTRMKNEDLEKYVVIGANYIPEAVESAIKELQKRGRIFGEDELAGIQAFLEQKKLKDREAMAHTTLLQGTYSSEVEVPEYYSRITVFLFSLLFSAAAGGFLLGSNIKKTGDNKAYYTVIIFGIAYVVLQGILFSLLPVRNTGYTYLSAVIGALVMDRYFWTKYIGMETPYIAKPVWKPLIITALIITPLLLITIYGQ